MVQGEQSSRAEREVWFQVPATGESVMDSADGGMSEAALPPPPPMIPPDVVPERADPVPPKEAKPKRVPMARPGLGKKGQKIPLHTNHFRVSIGNVDGYFFHYSVVLKYEDDRPVDGKGIGRKVIDRLQQIYHTELGGKDFAYDGEKSLFTVGSLPQMNNEFIVVLDDLNSNKSSANACQHDDDSPGRNERKRFRRISQSKTFKVELNFAAKVPMRSIKMAMQGHEDENFQEALRVLDVILRQHSSRQGCLVVRQSFFHNDHSNFTDLGGGVCGCRGFHSSFRTVQDGLSLNMDASTTMIVKPGPVSDFLLANQNVRNLHDIDWNKAKRMLKNLKIKAIPNNMEFRIVGLSELPCNQQKFVLKQRQGKDCDSEPQPTEVTVYHYFTEIRKVSLPFSGDFPCINVGKPKRPTYLPIEVCVLLPLQRYTKALTVFQQSALVERSRQRPRERMGILNNAFKNSKYNSEPILHSCGISISDQFTKVEGRVLPAPKLKLGNGEELFPRNGRWNLNNKTMFQAVKVDRWAVVNFSARCDMRRLINDLIRCGDMKGITIEEPYDVFEENPSTRRAPPHVRVEEMFEQIKAKLPGIPRFLLCLLPERKNCVIYGPWKKMNLAEIGIVTQCMAPLKVNDMYLSNLLLKINAKLGGLNSVLCVEYSPSIPDISNIPTIILGMDVSHGSPGRSDVPSIAAVVSSLQWPLISRYRAAVRSQSPKVEMIDSLFKPAANNEDEGIVKELLLGFYGSCGKRKPQHVIIFRDGVSESQFNQVLNVELDQIIEACKYLDESWSPKFTVIVAQKNHHTKFFQAGSTDNVPPGTVVDNKICHPHNFDFYMCAHAGMIGTTRPTHYHVLYDEIGFSADEIQELVHSLSYVYQRSTSAISTVAPVAYAHLAATQISQFAKFDDMSETSSSHGFASSGSIAVPELPRLHDKVSSSMFFC